MVRPGVVLLVVLLVVVGLPRVVVVTGRRVVVLLVVLPVVLPGVVLLVFNVKWLVDTFKFMFKICFPLGLNVKQFIFI